MAAADSSLQALLDERDIIAVGLRYAASIDKREFETLATCFTPDGAWGTQAMMTVGHAAIQAKAREALQYLKATQHVTTNFQVTLDGDRARMRSCYLATHVREADGRDEHWVIGGVYDDDLVRTPGGWRIAHRLLTNLWGTGDPAILGADFAQRAGLKA